MYCHTNNCLVDLLKIFARLVDLLKVFARHVDLLKVFFDRYFSVHRVP
jgi:hypothetical protein